MALEKNGPLTLNSLNCGDFLAFQEQLIRARKIDDNIVYMLNSSLPSESFAGAEGNSKLTKEVKEPTNQCRTLWTQLLDTHHDRKLAIERCIQNQGDLLISLKKQRDDGDSSVLINTLKKEQRKLRLMQSELNVEEVIRDRSNKIFQERCRRFYTPKSLV
jgi:hypothetical protein